MLSITRKAFIALIILVSTAISAQASSPEDTVMEWIKVYGTDQDRAAQLTTNDFRDGEPKLAWAYRTYTILRLVGYRHLGGTVIGKVIDDNRAVVVLQANISTVIGKVHQKEIYVLIRKDAHWLIDDLNVFDEVVEEQKVPA